MASEVTSEPIPYDAELQALLDDGRCLELLRLGQTFVVSVRGDAARYNSALWFAMKYSLRYDYDGERFTLYPAD